MNYGKAIRISRALADMSQRELASAMDADPSYISLIEANKREPSREFLEKFAEVFKMPLHLLILLATDESERENENKQRLQEVAESLAKLLFSMDDDGNGRTRNQPVKPRKPQKTRPTARRNATGPRRIGRSAERVL